MNYHKVKETEEKYFPPPPIFFQSKVKAFAFMNNIHPGKEEYSAADI
jgi:hypothetical protein